MNDATRGEGDDYEASGATTERREHTEGHARTAATGAAAMRTGRENESIQLREERLRVEKEQEQAGEVRLGKRVTEQEETVEVPLREERVVIERTPVTGDARAGEITGRDETIEVPLMRERANVEKEAVVTEEVNVRKESVQREEQVQATVRKEELEVDGEGDIVTDNPNASRQAGHEHEQTRRG